MGLLQEIVAGASGDHMPTSTLLRKCMVLAAKLDSKPAEDWVEWELNGYPEGVPIPDYRHLSMMIKVDMIDIARRANGWVVPPEFVDENGKNFMQHHYRVSIGEIEDYLAKGEATLQFQVGNLVGYLMAQKFTDMNILSAWCEVSAGKVKHITESVRTRILKFALDLEKAFPEAAREDQAMPQKSERVNQIFNTTIYGPANVVGAATNSSVSLNVKMRDFSSLASALRGNLVSEPDILELQKSVEAESPSSDGKVGPKVATWIGKMVSKAADGTWTIGTGAAGSLLADLIGKFYGWK